MKTVTPKIQQTGVYGMARPDEPLDLDDVLADRLVSTGNWVEGLTPKAQARQDAADAKAKADKAAAKNKAD